MLNTTLSSFEVIRWLSPQNDETTMEGAHFISYNKKTMGDVETIATRHRLEWLGHVARMVDYCLPQVCLFGWLPQV